MCRRQHFARSEWVRRESNPHQPGKNRRRSPLRHEPEQPHPSESNRDLPPFKRTRRPHTPEWDPGASANAPASMSLFGCQRPPVLPARAVFQVAGAPPRLRRGPSPPRPRPWPRVTRTAARGSGPRSRTRFPRVRAACPASWTSPDQSTDTPMASAFHSNARQCPGTKKAAEVSLGGSFARSLRRDLTRKELSLRGYRRYRRNSHGQTSPWSRTVPWSWSTRAYALVVF